MTPVLSALLALTAALAAQTATDIKLEDHAKFVHRELYEVGKRHLDIGTWARDAGLLPQATAQFLRADEAALGQHEGARIVLNVMRAYGDAFWRRERKHPGKALLGEYHKRVTAADRRDRAAYLSLAKSAVFCDRLDEARRYTSTALDLGASIELDAKGKHRLDGVAIPAALAEWLQQQTAEVGKAKVFEPARAGGFVWRVCHEVASKQLVVRTDASPERSSALHALGMALLPHLESRLGGAPTRPLTLLVLEKRTDFDTYVAALGLTAPGLGIADYGSFQTIICAEGLDDGLLQSMVLHELSHLFFFGTFPVAMPDWFAEGFAEAFGGQGTFTWNGTTLTVGGKPTKERLDALRQQPLPVRGLLAQDIRQLLAADRDAAHRYYTEVWALQQFLRRLDGPYHERFATFEAQCVGAGLGSRRGTFGDPKPAGALFERLFGNDLDALEAAFTAWLATQ
jgi:hypothetical protein